MRIRARCHRVCGCLGVTEPWLHANLPTQPHLPESTLTVDGSFVDSSLAEGDAGWDFRAINVPISTGKAFYRSKVTVRINCRGSMMR